MGVCRQTAVSADPSVTMDWAVVTLTNLTWKDQELPLSSQISSAVSLQPPEEHTRKNGACSVTHSCTVPTASQNLTFTIVTKPPSHAPQSPLKLEPAASPGPPKPYQCFLLSA